MKIEGSLPLMPNLEMDNKEVLKRKRSKQVVDVEDASPSEEDPENKAVAVARMIASEIKLGRGKVDTLLMDRTEYEEDLKAAFKILKEKNDVIRAKDSEISKWVVRVAKVGRRHAMEMEILRDDMVTEAVKSVFEARIEMMKEYQACEHINWNLDEEYAALKRIASKKMGEANSQVQDAEGVERVGRVGDNQEDETK